MRRKELFYYVTWGSNVTRDVHWCVTGFYQQIEISNIANQIHGFTIDHGKFILKIDRNTVHVFYFLNNDDDYNSHVDWLNTHPALRARFSLSSAWLTNHINDVPYRDYIVSLIGWLVHNSSWTSQNWNDIIRMDIMFWSSFVGGEFTAWNMRALSI